MISISHNRISETPLSMGDDKSMSNPLRTAMNQTHVDYLYLRWSACKTGSVAPRLVSSLGGKIAGACLPTNSQTGSASLQPVKCFLPIPCYWLRGCFIIDTRLVNRIDLSLLVLLHPLYLLFSWLGENRRRDLWLESESLSNHAPLWLLGQARGRKKKW